MNQGTNLGSQIGRWIVLAALVAVLGALLLTIQPVFAQSSPPGVPTGLRAVAVGVVGTNAVELSWTAPVAGRDSIMHYVIEHSTDNGASWTASGSVANTETGNTASGVQTHHAVDAAAGKNLYRVLAVNSIGPGDPSSRASVTPPASNTQPSEPQSVTATANGSTEINLSWGAPTTPGSGPVTQYKIEYSKDGSLPWMDLGTTTVTTINDGTKYSDKGLAPDTERHYRVSAINIAGRGPVSDSDDASTTLRGVPAAPTGLRAVALALAATDVVELYWTAPVAGGAPIEFYVIEHSTDDGASWTASGSVANTENENTASGVQTHHVVDAAVGKNLYRVSATNTIGMGPVSVPVTVTPPVTSTQPSEPQSVAALADGQNEIEVTWEAPATPGVGPVTQYKIEYSKDGSLPWMDLATAPASLRKYSNTGLAPDTERHYRVSAVNKAGRGLASPGDATDITKSPTVTSEPGKPTGLRAVAVGVVGTNAVELSWTAPVAGRDSIMHYVIEHSTDNGASWTASGSVANTETGNTASGVQTHHAVDAAAGKNLYRVLAVNSIGPGDPSTSASVTPPASDTQPSEPQSVTATANGSTEINLSWGAPTTPGSGPVTQYKIEYSKDGSLPWMDLGTTTVTTINDGTKYSDKGLAPDTERHYRVSAINIAGRGPVSDSDDASTTLRGVPAAPTGLRAVALALAATDVVELYWTAPVAGGAPIEFYVIEHSTDDGASWTASGSVANTENENTASGVQTHHVVDAAVGKNLYRVSATNTIGMGPVSVPVTVTPPVTSTQPSVPQSVAAREDGPNEIEVTWEAPATPGVGPVTQYKIEYSKDGSLPWMDLATAPASLRKYSNTGLAPDTERHYRVSAVNKAGRGPASPGDATDITAMGPPDQQGTLTLSTQEPMTGTPITATLVDDDGMVTGQVWKWEKSTNQASWMAATGSGAMTRTYTPVAADEGNYLRAMVTYTDAIGPDKMADAMTTGKVTADAELTRLLDKYDTIIENDKIDYVEVVAAYRSFLAGDANVPYTEVTTVYRHFLGG